MAAFILGCVLGAAIIAAVGAPFLAPWPLRVRYIVAAQDIDPFLGLSPTPRLDMRIVTLVSVETAAGQVELELAETGRHRETLTTNLSCTACIASDAAKIDGWAALHTPLLMITDEDHAVHLFGPDGAVIDLTASREKIR